MRVLVVYTRVSQGVGEGEREGKRRPSEEQSN